LKKETKTKFVRLQILVLVMKWINRYQTNRQSFTKKTVTFFSSFETQLVVFVVLGWILIFWIWVWFSRFNGFWV